MGDTTGSEWIIDNYAWLGKKSSQRALYGTFKGLRNPAKMKEKIWLRNSRNYRDLNTSWNPKQQGWKDRGTKIIIYETSRYFLMLKFLDTMIELEEEDKCWC